MPTPKLTREEAMHQIAIQITGYAPEVQALVMRCVEISYEAGYVACQTDLAQTQTLLLQSISPVVH